MWHKNIKLFAIVTVASVGLIALALFAVFSSTKTAGRRFVVRDQTFEIEMAQTESAMELGLGGRDGLAERHGMLFVFTDAGSHPFWMKGMRFPIDIVWINGEQVVGFSEDMLPEPGVPDERLRNYFPPTPADKVLEVPAGTVKEYGFTVGDKAVLLPN